jgi:hypothetical protein
MQRRAIHKKKMHSAAKNAIRKPKTASVNDTEMDVLICSVMGSTDMSCRFVRKNNPKLYETPVIRNTDEKISETKVAFLIRRSERTRGISDLSFVGAASVISWPDLMS